jgi:hypothetical protein
MTHPRLLAAFTTFAALLAGCGGAPPGLEKQWERMEAAQAAFDMCLHLHYRNPSACADDRSAYDAALKEYQAAGR